MFLSVKFFKNLSNLKNINNNNKLLVNLRKMSNENLNLLTDSTTKTHLNDQEQEDFSSLNKKMKLDNDVSQILDKEAKPIDLNDEIGDENTDTKSIRKRKYALLVGYSGEGYFGLQRFFI